MTAYIPPTSSEPMKIWVARRSEHKTYGGMLDNSVAGGIAVGISPLECMIKESGEEASLTPDFVKGRLRPSGCVTYFSERTAEAGGEVCIRAYWRPLTSSIFLKSDVLTLEHLFAAFKRSACYNRNANLCMT